MIRSLRAHAPLVAFGVGLAAIYAVAFVIVARLGQMDEADVIAGALTLDLTVLVPGLYYVLLVRWRGWSALSVLPVFLLSVLIAGRLIPAAQRHVLNLVEYAAVLVELAIVAVIAHKALRMRRAFREKAAAGMDVYESLREAAISVLGPVAGGMVAYEAAVFYYAFAGWRRSPRAEEQSFTVYRNTGYAALIVAVTIVLVVETVGVHMLVRIWSPGAAWVFTALSLYALVWMLGDLHAVRLRPMRVAGGVLRLRVGLRWTGSIPLGSIRAVRAPDEGPAREGDRLKAVLVGAPNRRLELAEPIHATGLYGYTRRVATIDLQVDEPDRFDAALG